MLKIQKTCPKSGNKMSEYPITDMFYSYINNTSKGNKRLLWIWRKKIFRQESEQISYDVFKQIWLFVISTGNKSEMSVGYCTLYGDMAGGLDVLSDVPKVYRL